MLKRFKPAYALYNLFQRSKLKHNVPLYRKYGLKKAYFAAVSAADFDDIPSETNKYDRLDSRDHLPSEVVYQKLKPEYREALLDWSAKGYAVLPGFFSSELVERVNEVVDHMLEDKKVGFKDGGRKVMFAYRKSPEIRALGEDPLLIEILDTLISGEVRLFQSINFLQPSEQRTHSDSIHMSTFPEGNLIAVWVALEDVGLENGPLHYYPGSHKLPYLTNRDFGNEGNALMLGNKGYTAYEDKVEEVVENNELKKEVFLAKKGDILIWHANLLHGGNSAIDPELTRKSMVFHYFAKGAICYHEVTQRPSLMG